jgi:hypothetical protein
MFTVALKPDATPVFTIPPQWFPSETEHCSFYVGILSSGILNLLVIGEPMHNLILICLAG